jgi:hypothetical protein
LDVRATPTRVACGSSVARHPSDTASVSAASAASVIAMTTVPSISSISVKPERREEDDA